jgi:antirestriction protein ArdC
MGHEPGIRYLTREGNMSANIYELVTDKIIAAMENGVVPWQKPWTGTGCPTSLTTGRPYRGINSLILEVVAMGESYDRPLWGTYKQAQALGGNIRKGEKGTPVVLWKPMEKDKGDGTKESFMMMRYFTVFNVAQMDDITIPEKFLIKREPVTVLNGIAEALSYPGGPEVRHSQQDRAYYAPASDTIVLPLLEQFTTPERYASTALHEIVHSTGHEDRLNRGLGNTFGCEKYAQEELVAEVGAAMLATNLGIPVEWDQHAAYLTSWLQVLREDRKMIVQAAQKAQKAIDHVTGEDPAVTALNTEEVAA